MTELTDGIITGILIATAIFAPLLVLLSTPYINMFRLQRRLKKIKEPEIDEETQKLLKEAEQLLGNKDVI